MNSRQEKMGPRSLRGGVAAALPDEVIGATLQRRVVTRITTMRREMCRNDSKMRNIHPFVSFGHGFNPVFCHELH